ncbi:hypothetical protein Cgig2_016340 [Carnegiea gigantea]|uniref:Uncharacterized protein n=1 Tax=Carnegiea gigantea TaxID=171969 RepID=A0A9Q1Q8G3_9CARY|nr:hypothetical protein Cgig2_016340 [Carnegiea gigantea]
MELWHSAHTGFSAATTPSPHFACSILSGKLACLPGRRQMFTMVNHGLQPVNPWRTDKLQPWNFGILLILASELHHTLPLCMCMGAGMFTPVCVLMMKYSFACFILSGNLACLPAIKTLPICSYWLLSCHHTLALVCILMYKYIGACTWGAGNLACLSSRR